MCELLYTLPGNQYTIKNVNFFAANDHSKRQALSNFLWATRRAASKVPEAYSPTSLTALTTFNEKYNPLS